MLLVRRVSKPAGGSPRLARVSVPPYSSPRATGVDVGTAPVVGDGGGAPGARVGGGLGVAVGSPPQDSAILPRARSAARASSLGNEFFIRFGESTSTTANYSI